MLSEISPTRSAWSYLYAKSKNVKLIVAERMVLPGAWGWEKWKILVKVYMLSARDE